MYLYIVAMLVLQYEGFMLIDYLHVHKDNKKKILNF